MEQKKFLKFCLTTEALQSYLPLFEGNLYDFLSHSPAFQGFEGSICVTKVMAELTIFMASRTLQGKEVRQKFDSTFAELYHDLDMGFTPVNFMMPWLPLLENRRRDHAQRMLANTYIEIIKARRNLKKGQPLTENDMIWHLMSCRYKNGNPIPDQQIVHMMIALLMAGQHSSSSVASWIMLRLASRPDIAEELYQEQVRVLGLSDKRQMKRLTYEEIGLLNLNSLVVKETLRLHAPIHSIVRAVKSPLTIQTNKPSELESRVYNIPTSHVLLSAPGVTAQSSEHFANPSSWDPHRWEAQPAVKDGNEKVDYVYGLVTKGVSSPYLPFGAGRHRCIGEQYHSPDGAPVQAETD
ncbi:Sterol 14-alpha demethylase [Lepraria neglecta]|uniref:Sterol 14-alpha demethylase n=1 Tax=Lepraria neglecta TaxID=209136 RepID=A0AAE0DN46_9LECA|nr:Sterol 14-alpha demethylase [Lepraria neglecta]